MKRLLILADDLTGAADCAAGFIPRAACCVVLRASATLPPHPVVALDLDTRGGSAEVAVRRHREAAVHRGMALYKKIDSTLRGHWAAEVAALRGRGLALVAPAYPELGRTTEGGVQCLNGIPVSDSETWRNEGVQGSADLYQQLVAQGLRCERLAEGALGNAAAIAQAVEQALAQGLNALVCDAHTAAHLSALAQASAGLWQQVFWVGSAGLAKALQPWLSAPGPAPLQPATGPVLAVVGSMASHSHQQADALAAASAAFSQTLTPAEVLGASAPGIGQTLANVLRSGQPVVVRLSQAERKPAQAQALSQALARHLQPALAVAGTLLATGGETARALLEAAGIERLLLQAEPTPGLVRAHAEYQGRTLTVVTKAGAFGHPDALCAAWRSLNLALPRKEHLHV